jgi:hypothetical protein
MPYIKNDAESIRLFCLMLLPICHEENLHELIDLQFADLTQEERGFLYTYFGAIKKRLPDVPQSFSLSLGQLPEFLQRLGNPENSSSKVFVSLLREMLARAKAQQTASSQKVDDLFARVPTFTMTVQEFARKKGETVKLHATVSPGKSPSFFLSRTIAPLAVVSKALPQAMQVEAEAQPREKKRKKPSSWVSSSPRASASRQIEKREIVRVKRNKPYAHETLPLAIATCTHKIFDEARGSQESADTRKREIVQISSSTAMQVEEVAPPHTGERIVAAKKNRTSEPTRSQQTFLNQGIRPLWREWSGAFPIDEQEKAARTFFTRYFQEISTLPKKKIEERLLAAAPLVKEQINDSEFVKLFDDVVQFVGDNETSEQVAQFTLRQVGELLKDGLTPYTKGEAGRLFGATLFLRDHAPEALLGPLTGEKIIKETRARLTETFEKFHPANISPAESGLIKDAVFISDKCLIYYQNRYAARIADLLLDTKRGLLNRYLIDEAIESLFPKKNRSAFDIHAQETLLQFKGVDQLSRILEGARVPQANNRAGQRAVRSTLLLKPEQEITLRDVRRTILATTMCHWAQLDYGSCATTATFLTVESAALQWICEDYSEIIERGSIERVVGRRRSQFLASPKATPWLFGREISLDKGIHTACRGILSCADFRYAFSVLGITEEKLEMIVNRVSDAGTVTFDAIFTYLKEKEKGISLETLDFARFIIGSTFEASLTRLWENTAMGFDEIPLLDCFRDDQASRVMSVTLLETWYQLTLELLRKFPDNKQIQALRDTFSEAMTNNRLHPDEIPKNFNFDDPTKTKEGEALRAQMREGLIVSLMPEEVARVLNRFRFFMEPGRDPADTGIHCCLYVQKENTYEKIESQEQMEQALQGAFNSIAERIVTVKPAAHLTKLSETFDPFLSSKLCEAYFSTILRATRADFFPVLDDNKPWNFVKNGMSGIPVFSFALRQKRDDFARALAPLEILEGRKPSEEFVRYAEEVRRQFGSSNEVAVPISLLKHGCRFFPNRSLVVPKNVSFQDWISDKERRAMDIRLDECPKTREKVLEWADRELEGISFIRKWWYPSNIRAIMGKPQSLHSFLNAIFLEVKKYTETPDERELHGAYFEGLERDKPELANDLMLCVCDSNWVMESERQMERNYFYLYFNPLSKNWNLVCHQPGKVTSPVHPNEKALEQGDTLVGEKFPIQLLGVLEAPMKDKRVLMMKAELLPKMKANGEKFRHVFDTFEQLIGKLAPQERQKFLELFPLDSTLEGLQAKIIEGRKGASKGALAVFDALEELRAHKAEQQKIMNEICSQQDPPVDQLLDALFVTRVQERTIKDVALDTDPDTFFTILRGALETRV